MAETGHACSDRGRGVDLALFSISASSLLTELYWLRAFAEIEWGHLASMVVSTSMLGIGIGSTAILLIPRPFSLHSSRLWSGLLAMACLSTALSPSLVALLPFDALLLPWRLSAWSWLLLRELLVAIPFVFAAAAITLRFRVDARSARVYGINLLGAALGVAAGLLAMLAYSMSALLILAVGFAVVATVSSISRPVRRGTALALGLVLCILAPRWGTLPLSATKGLRAALALPDVEVLSERHGPRGRWTLLRAPSIHSIAGMSLLSPPVEGELRAIFVRGDPVGSVLEADATEILKWRLSWLPLQLRRPDSVLILEESTGLEAQSALLVAPELLVSVVSHGRSRAALAGGLGEFAGFTEGRPEIMAGPPRSALARLAGDRSFDLVMIAPRDGLAAAAAGLGSSMEDFLLTEEGLGKAWSLLAPHGQLAIQRWTQAPPRDLPKLLASCARILWANGVEHPPEHMVLLRHWDAWCLVLSRSVYSGGDRQRLADFASRCGFDVILPTELRSPPRHLLPGPNDLPLLDEILESGGVELGDSAFDLRPARDGRPFFHHYLSLSRLPDHLKQLRDGSYPPADWGDFFLLAGLFLALVLGALLILLPTLVLGRTRAIVRTCKRGAALFACLGLGYMFLEVLWIQQAVRVLGDATVSASVILAVFLCGSGVGGVFLSRWGGGGRIGAMAALIVAGAALLSAVSSTQLFDILESMAAPVQWGGVLLLVFLTALPMGVPLPVGVTLARRYDGHRVPWLLAINGWASVVAPVLASLLALSLGFVGLGTMAAALYLGAALLLAGESAAAPSPSKHLLTPLRSRPRPTPDS